MSEKYPVLALQVCTILLTARVFIAPVARHELFLSWLLLKSRYLPMSSMSISVCEWTKSTVIRPTARVSEAGSAKWD